jgi:hypothetical protein
MQREQDGARSRNISSRLVVESKNDDEPWTPKSVSTRADSDCETDYDDGYNTSVF